MGRHHSQGGFGMLGRQETFEPTLKVMSLHILCISPSSNFWDLEVCDFCDIFPPKEDTEVERWDYGS